MKIVLLGAPGAGKGTQAIELSKKFQIPAISTGHIIRSAIADQTPLGKEMKEYMDRGALVPDSIVVEMVKERLKEDDCKKGYILDGFPRTVAQAEIMEKLPIEVDLVLEIAVDTDIIVDRLSGRRECKKCGATYHIKDNPTKQDGICDHCGDAVTQRPDDVPEVIKNRIEVYQAQTAPLKQYYEAKNLLVTVEGQGKITDTTKAVLAAVEKGLN